MNAQEFVDKLITWHVWFKRISLLLSQYFAYLLVTPSSIVGWIMMPIVGVVIWLVLE